MVSIIIPVYNTEPYLRMCLQSIAQQRYTALEVICVNDGSTDNSEAIIKEFVDQDERFIYIEKEHTNAGDARNTGLAAARGDYFLFLDSDDFFDPDMVLRSVEKAMETNADITIFQYKLYDNRTGSMLSKTYGIHTNRRKPFSLFELSGNMFAFTNIAVWNKLYRADFIRKYKLFFQPSPALNDVFFSWAALVKAERIALSRHTGVYYRINTERAISDNLARTSGCFVRAFTEINAYLKNTGIWEYVAADIVNVEKAQFQIFLSRIRKKSEFSEISDRFECDMELFFEQWMIPDMAKHYEIKKGDKTNAPKQGQFNT